VKLGLYFDRARDIEGRVGIVNGQFDFGLADLPRFSLPKVIWKVPAILRP